MDDTNDTPAEQPDVPTSVEYNNRRSVHFRVVHADGATGGATPNGRQIQFAFYSERAPLREFVQHEVRAVPAGFQVGPEIPPSRDGKLRIEREMEVDIRMDISIAHDFYMWLGRQLAAHVAAVEAQVASQEPK